MNVSAVERKPTRQKREYTVISSNSAPGCGLYYKCAYIGDNNYKWYIQNSASASLTKVINGDFFGRVEQFKDAVDDASAAAAAAALKSSGGIIAALAPFIVGKNANELMNASYGKLAAFFIAGGLGLSAVGESIDYVKAIGKADFHFGILSCN